MAIAAPDTHNRQANATVFDRLFIPDPIHGCWIGVRHRWRTRPGSRSGTFDCGAAIWFGCLRPIVGCAGQVDEARFYGFYSRQGMFVMANQNRVLMVSAALVVGGLVVAVWLVLKILRRRRPRRSAGMSRDTRSPLAQSR